MHKFLKTNIRSFQGSHNFNNEFCFQVLDVAKADGIKTIPNGAFANLENLEKLIMTGCSLSVLDESMFEGLANLKEVIVSLTASKQIDDKIYFPFLLHKTLSACGLFYDKLS